MTKEVTNHTHQMIDEAEALLVTLPGAECPLVHRFTPGLYIRELFMPAGTVATTKIHRTEHPFFVSKGRVNIFLNGEIQEVEAPYCGITLPGTRRVLYCLTDVVWTTVHSNKDDCRDLLEIERRLIEPHDNELLSEETKLKNYLNQKPCHSLELQPE